MFQAKGSSNIAPTSWERASIIGFWASRGTEVQIRARDPLDLMHCFEMEANGRPQMVRTNVVPNQISAVEMYSSKEPRHIPLWTVPYM